MTEGHDLVHIYTGSQVDVEYIREQLEENEIPCLIKDDFQTGIHAGFAASGPDLVEVFVEEENAQRATNLIKSLQQEGK